MFDIGALELLMIAVVAIIVIGPKDMPAALRVAGRWVGKLRNASAQFRAGFDSIVREAEMEDMEKKWKEQNARIMAETPAGEMGPLETAADPYGESGPDAGPTPTKRQDNVGELPPGPADITPVQSAKQSPRQSPRQSSRSGTDRPDADEPTLPLGKPRGK
ncbi:Sec-independent protein translocase protein TatB [Pontixanthobacter sp.]|uniref:Sec-independent protein translocase protein TatB n=1 Tax=Pontixanthobacter sp. TaxID=2792078 RepID=UPI003C7B0A5D